MSGRSSDLSALLDGIGNGVQTIPAANTGLTKLQSLTNQLKSTAQQALSSSNAFTAKATSSSTPLAGATASNLLSTGSTVARANEAVGTLTGSLPPTAAVAATVAGGIDYTPTASATKLTGAVYTPTVPSVARAGGTTFTAPAKAVAGTASGTGYTAPSVDATLTVTSGAASATNRPITVNLVAGDSKDAALGNIQAALTRAGSTVTAALDSDRIGFTGASNGDALNVVGSDAKLGFGPPSPRRSPPPASPLRRHRR